MNIYDYITVGRYANMLNDHLLVSAINRLHDYRCHYWSRLVIIIPALNAGCSQSIYLDTRGPLSNLASISRGFSSLIVNRWYECYNAQVAERLRLYLTWFWFQHQISFHYQLVTFVTNVTYYQSCKTGYSILVINKTKKEAYYVKHLASIANPDKWWTNDICNIPVPNC